MARIDLQPPPFAFLPFDIFDVSQAILETLLSLSLHFFYFLYSEKNRQNRLEIFRSRSSKKPAVVSGAEVRQKPIKLLTDTLVTHALCGLADAVVIDFGGKVEWSRRSHRLEIENFSDQNGIDVAQDMKR